ncbi:uncharacterized protein LOC107007555 isoform X2 [Solanum pennellii]|uniref:Uncharacterized protein LOC107007555 isoform X2 n=1 Tax=Solanum pennellii TaxID=28526 RepID=A0ABM1VE11_SOLPN|nr:uncharacterized protein LOC107007555 isoform X2 [Solanum pennellii]
MHSKVVVGVELVSSSSGFCGVNHRLHHPFLFKTLCCTNNSSSSSSSSEHKFRFNLGGDRKWKFKDIDASTVQESVNHWLSKTHNFWNEVTSPLVKTVNDKRTSFHDDTQDTEEVFMAEQTVDSQTPNGDLSVAAILSIEQFSRMNGLTGQKMQKIFKALVPESVHSDARNLVEYCCFRFLSKDTSVLHPCLKEPAFQRLVFVTMLAWEQPYRSRGDSRVKFAEKHSLQRRLVGEEAFVRIAPAVAGIADWTTAHNLFKALAGNDRGIAFSSWSTYICELLKVHEGRKSYQFQDLSQLHNERILCIASGGKRPVLKWENNMAWPGKLILTDRALYFEGVGLTGKRKISRLDLTGEGSHIKRTRVGPLGFDFLDSAVSVTSGPQSDTWVLEFVDFGGEMRRDVWYACISEVIALYKFIREFGPEEGDPSVYNVYGSQKGKARAISYATNAVKRLQALQYARKLLEEPTKLVQFSYLYNAPYGDVVLQTLAVNCWGGPLIAKITDQDYQSGGSPGSTNDTTESSSYVFDIDGSVYLQKWMKSPSWASSASLAFWKNPRSKRGIVFSKNLVVADINLMEKAALICRDKYQVVEKTQATIDAAMIEGIPSNIDLFKELVFPLTVVVKNFEKLRHWEDPLLTASSLALVYTIIFRNMLSYILPATLMGLAAGMLLLKGLKEQGRLGRYFGKVTIRDQPPSNTLQKIIAVKEALREVEKYMQSLNVSLLKIRAIILAGQPQITMEVALALLFGATILLIVPFKYIAAFLISDAFTRELAFRRQMVLRFMSFLKERWETVPATPVVVLPFEEDESDAPNQRKLSSNDVVKPEKQLKQ